MRSAAFHRGVGRQLVLGKLLLACLLPHSTASLRVAPPGRAAVETGGEIVVLIIFIYHTLTCPYSFI